MHNEFTKTYRSMISEMNDQIMKQMGFQQQVNDVHNGICPFCKKPVDMNQFKDQLSKKEYKISGLCQKCQDQMFGASEEEQQQSDFRQMIIAKLETQPNFFKDFAPAAANYGSEKGLAEAIQMMEIPFKVLSKEQLITYMDKVFDETLKDFANAAANYLPEEDLQEIVNNNPEIFDNLQNEDYSNYSPISPSDI